MKGPALLFVVLCLAPVFILSGISGQKAQMTYKVTLSEARYLQHRYEAESAISNEMYRVSKEIQQRKKALLSGLTSSHDNNAKKDSGPIADNRPRTKIREDGIKTTITLTDANSGLSLSGSQREKILLQSLGLGQEHEESARMALAQYTDYTDRNEAPLPQGAENGDYLNLEDRALPRNGRLEFAEELLWLPHMRELLSLKQDAKALTPKVSLRILPFPGVNFPMQNRSSFYAATSAELQTKAGLDTSEVLDLVNRRDREDFDVTTLKQSLSPPVYNKLQRHFSFSDSGVYRLRIEVSREDNSGKVILERIINLKTKLPNYRKKPFFGLRSWRQTSF